MASIRQRSGTWQARVRRRGYPDEVASFKTKIEAQAWARSVESAMDQGAYHSAQSAQDILLADVLKRYMHEVTPSKRGAQREAEGIQSVGRGRQSCRIPRKPASVNNLLHQHPNGFSPYHTWNDMA